MPGGKAAVLLLDHVHCRAICDEIGERLREVLKREVPAMPSHLCRLIDRLAELESEPAPSIVLSMDDICFDEQPLHAARRIIKAELTAATNR